MKKGIIPYSGIDTYVKLDIFIQKKDRWIFEYKLYPISSNGFSIVIPLSSVDFTTAASINVYDNQVYSRLISCLAPITIKKKHYMTADPEYDNDQNLIISVWIWDFNLYVLSCLSI
jgi:hypothetical protein